MPGPIFHPGDRRVLLPLRGVSDWDIAPDGQRIIMSRDVQGAERRRLVVVENFLPELKAKSHP